MRFYRSLLIKLSDCIAFLPLLFSDDDDLAELMKELELEDEKAAAAKSKKNKGRSKKNKKKKEVDD